MASPLKPMARFQNIFIDMFSSWPDMKIAKTLPSHWIIWLPELKQHQNQNKKQKKKKSFERHLPSSQIFKMATSAKKNTKKHTHKKNKKQKKKTKNKTKKKKHSNDTLRKHAYLNILKFLSPKLENFR